MGGKTLLRILDAGDIGRITSVDYAYERQKYYRSAFLNGTFDPKIFLRPPAVGAPIGVWMFIGGNYSLEQKRPNGARILRRTMRFIPARSQAGVGTMSNPNPICRVCNTLLVTVNWFASYEKKNNRICRTCSAQQTLVWRRENPDRGKRTRDLYVRSPARRYPNAVAQAKSRGAPFTFTKEEYDSLIAQPCIYCGFPLNPTGVGLDQKVSKVGYTPGNAVPCCGVCNTTKSDFFTYEEMLEIGKAIRAVRLKREKA